MVESLYLLREVLIDGVYSIARPVRREVRVSGVTAVTDRLAVVTHEVVASWGVLRSVDVEDIF